jgi:hypothetical protein
VQRYMVGFALCCLFVSSVTAAAAPPNPDQHYTIRAVIRIRNPVHVDAMSDDRQTATIVRSTEEYTDVAFTLFPLIAPVIEANPQWREDAAHLQEFVRPGATANWDESMRRDLVAALKADGIDVDALDNKTLVERVSLWLYRRTKRLPMFDTWFVEFDEQGTPRVASGLEAAFRSPNGMGDVRWTDREQIERELLGRSMFASRCTGTCTSQAILLQTVLRALGVPTRLILSRRRTPTTRHSSR